jgi:hypothetical protein
MLCDLQPDFIPPIFRILIKFNTNHILNYRAWIWLFAVLKTSCVFQFASCSYAVFKDNHYKEATVVAVDAREF